uniref:Uncharacterized protein n=1 Tax=Anguilla anguilla TaxID=7936 RepID=A0A0E9TL64_ANGAN
MAGIILTRSISRSLLPASKHVKTKRTDQTILDSSQEAPSHSRRELVEFFLLNCLSCCSNFAVLCVSQL